MRGGGAVDGWQWTIGRGYTARSEDGQGRGSAFGDSVVDGEGFVGGAGPGEVLGLAEGALAEVVLQVGGGEDLSATNTCKGHAWPEGDGGDVLQSRHPAPKHRFPAS